MDQIFTNIAPKACSTKETNSSGFLKETLEFNLLPVKKRKFSIRWVISRKIYRFKFYISAWRNFWGTVSRKNTVSLQEHGFP
jgi:hypothetical protein